MLEEKLAGVWPEWQIETQLGKGSYGSVFKAVRRDNNVESYSAIKVISIPNDESEVDTLRSEGIDMNGTRTYFKGIVDDFVSEIRLMESLKGIQNIVSVEDYKVIEKESGIGWDIYIRMELLTPFNAYICNNKLTEKDVIKLGIDVCTALEICSQRNIIHRDIKPENIFINDFGYYKLGDFGIARKLENVTGGLSQKGTLNYIAPEVANSSNYDARADIYSLGIVLYRLLNGNKLPFIENDAQLLDPMARKSAVERRIRGERLLPPCEASPEMADLILRACAYLPQSRFASAEEMKKALISVSEGRYVIVGDPDMTTAVHPAQTDNDATTAVRRAAAAYDNTTTLNEPTPTFGKKKSKAPAIIAILLIVALLIAAAVFVLPKFLGDSDGDDVAAEETDKKHNKKNDTSEPSGDDTVGKTDTNGVSTNNGSNTESEPDETDGYYSDPDQQIASIISDAEKFAALGNYSRAIDKINAGLASYPGSVELQNKLDDYKTKLAQQNKQKVLDDAAALAAKEDYLQALRTIENAQKDLPSDVDYEIAYNNYCSLYEDAVIKQADELAAKNDFDGATAIIVAAEENVKNSKKFSEAKDRYSQVLPVTTLNKLQPTKFTNDSYTENKYFVINGKVKSYLGDVYTDGLIFKQGKKRSSSIEYDLGGQYRKLTGKISMIESGNVLGLGDFTTDVGDFVYLDFIADGESIYTSPLTNPTIDYELNIDLTGVTTLKIRIVVQNENGYYGYNACTALTNMQLYK